MQARRFQFAVEFAHEPALAQNRERICPRSPVSDPHSAASGVTGGPGRRVNIGQRPRPSGMERRNTTNQITNVLHSPLNIYLLSSKQVLHICHILTVET